MDSAAELSFKMESAKQWQKNVVLKIRHIFLLYLRNIII